ncbi:hypothetical protein DYB30_002534 [Aphanomyces astaci]|uniref:AMP-dependent synthetase/ligase domain-containing protein n=2 Tax=Aphanomyces astaci TaxID=112090 RepID=A0A397D767_APHAT|nr:hypothetical protein DYB30_002534 [Aphanomyces astaci]
MPTGLWTKVVTVAAGAAAAAYVDKNLYLSHDIMTYWQHAISLLQAKYLIARNTRVADLWEELVDAMPSKVLVMFEGKKYTAVQLETEANRIAHWAMSVGLTPGSIVALLMENRPEFLTTWIGLSKVGVVAALINTHVAEEGLLHCINVSDASVVIFGAECTEQMHRVLDRLPPRISGLYVYNDVHTVAVKDHCFNIKYCRDANGHLIQCAVGTVGELLLPVRSYSPMHKFQGYFKDDAASATKLLANAFQKGDLYFRTGDLFRMDNHRRFYFVDRVGDTFRWNGENVATCEVAEALSGFPGISDICVYGVALPGRDGRAGMAAMVFESLDMDAFAKFCLSKLPSYAVPRFLRQVPAMHVTGTMKHEKAKLRAQGVQLSGGDRVFYLDRSNPSQPTYLALTDANVHSIVTASRL